MRSIRVRVDQDSYNVGSIVFSGGEIHVDISHFPQECNDYSIKAVLTDSESIMHFMMLCDAMYRRYPKVSGTVIVPYMPYARQDRVCASGQHFGMDAMAKILGTIPQSHLVTYDLHSNVSESLLNLKFRTVRNISQLEIIQKCSELDRMLRNHELVLVSPDKGATQKTRLIAEHYGSAIIVGDKKRDSVTGKLNGFSIDVDSCDGLDLLIVDDICDGGGTFLGLAEECKRKGASSIRLYVTHGIFSKGHDIFDSIIDKFYVSDSIVPMHQVNAKQVVIKL